MGGGAGDMNSILPLLLLSDSDLKEAATKATTDKTTCETAAGTDADKKKKCADDYQTALKKVKKDHAKDSKLTDLLLLTSLAGPGGMGAGGMNSLLPLLLIDGGLGSGSDSSDLLPLLLLSGGLGGGAVDPITGQQGGL